MYSFVNKYRCIKSYELQFKFSIKNSVSIFVKKTLTLLVNCVLIYVFSKLLYGNTVHKFMLIVFIIINNCARLAKGQRNVTYSTAHRHAIPFTHSDSLRSYVMLMYHSLIQLTHTRTTQSIPFSFSIRSTPIRKSSYSYVIHIITTLRLRQNDTTTAHRQHSTAQLSSISHHHSQVKSSSKAIYEAHRRLFLLIEKNKCKPDQCSANIFHFNEWKCLYISIKIRPTHGFRLSIRFVNREIVNNSSVICVCVVQSPIINSNTYSRSTWTYT